MEKYIITGILKNLTGLHCGGVGAEFHSDMPLALDGSGCYYIPGSSIAGALRDYLKRCLGEYNNWYNWDNKRGLHGGQDEPTSTLTNGKHENICIQQLFGYQHGNDGCASVLLIEDAQIIDLSGVSVRDHVVIVRETGTAAPGLKFDREVIQAGSSFEFRLEFSPRNKQQAEDLGPLVQKLLKALQDGEIMLGGATSRGLGRIKLAESDCYGWNLEEKPDFEDYLSFLAGGESSCKKSLPDFESYTAEPFLAIRFICGIDGPFMIKESASDERRVTSNSDIADLMCLKESNSDGEEVYVIPGSSIKGAFRVHAERIIKQARNQKFFHAGGKPWYSQFMESGFIDLKKFGRYLEERRGKFEPLEVSRCFGDEIQGQGCLLFEDSYFKNIENLTKVTNHVAIDPLTGGGINGALYSMEAIWNDDAEFELGIRVQRPELWQLGLLGHLLKDLFTGRIRLGYGKTKGMGKIKLIQVKSINAALPDLFNGDTEVKNLPVELTEDARQWIITISDAFNEKMRDEEMVNGK